ncbi:DUF6223 family protein [Streptomyces flaveolus]|jgi:hypothetical protein|uniref:DUF6223 family protein n=1 Tax=Streptomyces flaveolus TaxID=67297 RepID=UPI0033B78CF9
MSVRHLLAVTAVVPLGGVWLASPAAAHPSVQPVAAGFYDFSLGRLGATAGALLGLFGVVIAGLALARPASRLGAAGGSLGATVAVVAGLISISLGGLVAATAEGGLGTGNGLGGAYVAMLVGLIGISLGALALARSRRTG